MKTRYIVLTLTILIGIIAFWVQFLWLTSTPDGISYMFRAQGFNVEQDSNLKIGWPNGTNLGLSKFIATYREFFLDPRGSCCKQAQAWRISQNPVITQHWKGLWGNHHVPQYYWSFIANGTQYNWVSWDGNPR